MYHLFLRKVDIFSCETLEVYHTIQNSGSSCFNLGPKLVFLPNGFDEEYFWQLNIKEKTFVEKENIILTVGMLDIPRKNVEMFLKVLEEVNLKDWKVCLVGPVGDRLLKYMEAFYKKRPEYQSKVIFTGPIYDKKELWEYYNRAKVFVLTSRSESSGLVLCEAKRFRNYLVSTDVGAFADLCEDGKYGCSVEQDNDKQLKIICQNIIDGGINVDVYQEFETKSLSWTNLLKAYHLYNDR